MARLDGLEQVLVTYPDNVAGGYTVVPGDGTSHFGLVLNASDPPVVHPGVRRDHQAAAGGHQRQPGQHRRPVHPAARQQERGARRPERAGAFIPVGQDGPGGAGRHQRDVR